MEAFLMPCGAAPQVGRSLPAPVFGGCSGARGQRAPFGLGSSSTGGGGTAAAPSAAVRRPRAFRSCGRHSFTFTGCVATAAVVVAARQAERPLSAQSARRSQRRVAAVVARAGADVAGTVIAGRGESGPPPSIAREPCLADEVRADFAALSAEAHTGVPLVYLDSAATSQKPACVLAALTHYYESSANVHRGAHALAERATEAFEAARESVARLIGARSANEVVFTSGATEAINLVAGSWGISNLGPGDRVVLTEMEHHSNLVPWQLVAQRTGAELAFARVARRGELDVEHMESLITPRTRLVTLAHVSNTLGCVNPVRRIAATAHRAGALVLLDACQSVPHLPVDVQDLGADWIAASGHKMCGPTGVGFLWGREELLRQMPPWKGGGEMIKEVTLEGSTFADVPARFEAGTPPIAQAVGLGAACEYLLRVGMDRIAAYEHQLSERLWEAVASVDGLRLYGPPPRQGGKRAALVAFNDTQEDVYPVDIALLLDADGCAVRAGHHCAQPLHKTLDAPFGSVRASLSFYNTPEDVDRFARVLRESLEMLRSGEGCVFDPDDPEACFCSSSRMRS
mmetsp:Transcript_64652/g.192631  ORF Transcript_64652/g.192631 Transcript_64652/m.192631 type:complete len:572 (+) Transcript_64652:79-1794(+)